MLSRRLFLRMAASSAAAQGLGRLIPQPDPPPLAWPIAGAPGPAHPVCAAFGPRLLGGDYDWHPGIDLEAPPGATPVLAAEAGRVLLSAGGSIRIRHERPALSTVYEHLGLRLAGPGQRVARGQPIGLAGPAGRLHFEVRVGDLPANPYGYLSRPERGAPSVEVLWVDSANMPARVDAHVRVRTPRDELDVDRVRVSVFEKVSGALLDRRSVDFGAAHNCGTDDPCVAHGRFSVCISPAPFDRVAPTWEASFVFAGLRAAETVVVVAEAIDCGGSARTASTLAP